METEKKALYTLIPLEDFKAVLGIDDREDALSRYCLVTATFTIEQYCMRRLLKKRYFENLPFWGDYSLSLTHYPVTEILATYIRQVGNTEMTLLEPEMYTMVPDCGSGENWPFALLLSSGLRIERGEYSVKAVYKAGYVSNPHPCVFETAASMPQVPPDLASACMELAAWNMNRYKGRRIGMTGSVRGGGKDGEHFEMSMPMQVRQLLEPYKRKVI